MEEVRNEVGSRDVDAEAAWLDTLLGLYEFCVFLLHWSPNKLDRVIFSSKNGRMFPKQTKNFVNGWLQVFFGSALDWPSAQE